MYNGILHLYSVMHIDRGMNSNNRTLLLVWPELGPQVIWILSTTGRQKFDIRLLGKVWAPDLRIPNTPRAVIGRSAWYSREIVTEQVKLLMRLSLSSGQHLIYLQGG